MTGRPAAPERVETERLVLTRPVPSDLGDLEALLAHPDVAAWFGGPPEPGETDELLAAHAAGWDAHGFGLWMARDRVDGTFVGRGGVQLSPVGGPGAVEVAWAVVPERWGAGLATEMGRAGADVAGRDLGLEEIVAFTLPGNVASRRVMEKLGLVLEGEVAHHGLAHVLYRGGVTRAAATAPGA